MVSKIKYEESDSKLIYYVREGNDDAKEYLYRKFSPLIHKELNRVKGKAFAVGIEYLDLVQEAMLAFSYAINSYDEEEDVKFITFATTCVRRKLLNFIDKSEKQQFQNQNGALPLDAPLEDKKSIVDQVEELMSNEPLKKVINSETLKEISKLIDEKLSKNEKIALMYNLSGRSIDEIADAMQMSSKQIYNLIHRARGKIKAF